MTKRSILGTLAAAAFAVGCGSNSGDAPAALRTARSSSLQGTPAGYTTVDESIDGTGKCLNGNPGVNCNIYTGKNYVWMNGGPGSFKGAGYYYFAVFAPGGQPNPADGTDKNLSDTVAAPDTAGATNSDGSTVPAGDLWTDRLFYSDGNGNITYPVVSNASAHDQDGAKIRLMPYDDTPNNGGVYVMAICFVGTNGTDLPANLAYPPASANCKYDAFKVKTTPTTNDKASVAGLKYYDPARLGYFDSQVGIEGWPIDCAGNTEYTIGDGTFSDENVDPGENYTCAEQHPSGQIQIGSWGPYDIWSETGNTNGHNQTSPPGIATLDDFIYTFDLAAGDTLAGLNFGNACIGPNGNARTIGYWQTHANLITSTDFIALNALNLAGAPNNTATKTCVYTDFTGTLAQQQSQFSTWLQKAYATNMAYMLSAQLAGMKLNVLHGFVSVNDTIAGATMTIGQLMAAADAALASNNCTISDSTARTTQTTLKNLLDQANNGVGYTQGNPASCYPLDGIGGTKVCTATLATDGTVTSIDCSALF